MKTLSIDIETFSPINLAKAGVYPYAENEDFDILLFGYSIDHRPVRVVDLASGEELPEEILAALVDPGVVKWAFNAAFERVCISSWLRKHHPNLLPESMLDPAQWRCTMVWAAYLGLPMRLEHAARVLNLEIRIDATGKRLLKQFCVPAQPTLLNSANTRNPPESDPQAWKQFIAYNVRDVEVEQALRDRLDPFRLPEAEWAAYALDQYINDTGIHVDQQLVDNAVRINETYREKILQKAKKLTGLENPNSPIQLRDWLNEHGYRMQSLTRTEVATALESATGTVRQVLQLRSELAKSSVKKYQAMQQAVCADGRARGLIQFYGAGRTGRFAGRLIQVQNLPRNHISDLAQARSLVSAGNSGALELLYDSVPDTLSQLIRTAFIPSPTNRFIITDFSAIEARVIAWLAGEENTLQAFRDGKDLYCETASRMFAVPVEKHGENAHLRQKGKIAVLACGYSGSVGALKAMGALRMGIEETELKPIVDAWRSANPRIVQLWADVDEAAIRAVTTRQPTELRQLVFSHEEGILFIALPSGRRLAYVKPELDKNRFGGTSITYSGVTNARKWGPIETYGGKLVENIVQAIARDLLINAMYQVSQAGYRIVMHVHDEIIIDHPQAAGSVEEVCQLMSQPPTWALGLPLDADGFESSFYRKE